MDSVALDEAISEARSSGSSGCRGTELTLQSAVLLLFVFLLICSDYFINNVVSLIPGATRGREVLGRGIMVQGTLLILLYALGNYLLQEHIL